jgi:hypothetical protein
MKQTKIVLFSCFALGLFSLNAQAQQLSGSAELTVLTKSDFMVQSVLSGASSVQVSALETYQIGNDNVRRINPQTGENQIRLIQQGNSNTMDLQLYGEGNNYRFSQVGNNNDLQLRNLEANNNTLQIMQRGNGNQLIDNGSGLLNRPLRIEQSGGMKVLINGQ